LLGISQSTQTWNNAYGNHLRIVNLETMALLRRYWTYYSNANNVSASFTETHKIAVKKIYNRYHKDGASMPDVK
jgi:hypothetical protein